MNDHGEQPELEAQMVLYIAGELTNGQQRAFEQRLASDPRLSAELTKLRETQVFCADALRAMDEQRRLPVNEGVAVRRVGRAMAQWQVDRARRAVIITGKTRRVPAWSYPVAAAAVLIIGFLIWSSRQPISPLPAPDGVAAAPMDGSPEAPVADDQQNLAQTDTEQKKDALADWIDNSFGNTQQASTVTSSEHALSDPAPIPGTDEGVGPLFPSGEETVQ